MSSNEYHKHSEAVKSMSYSQKKRAQLDYREVYFSHNPGLFGCIWFCAYCKRPLIGKHNVQVDHIVPLNSPFCINKGFNLVSSCARCNQEKSDKVDGRVPVGFGSKFIDFIVFSVQKILVISFVAAWTLVQKVISLAVKMLLAPYRSGSYKLMIIATVAYFLVFLVIKTIV